MNKNGKFVKCPVCGNQTYFRLARIKRGARYCSRKCSDLDKIGTIPDNLETARKNSPIGKPGNSYHKKGVDHWHWQAENPSYRAVHAWMRKQKQKTGVCAHCLQKKITQWANISREYNRSIDDFMELCPSCHKNYDLEYKKKNGVI